MKNLQQIFEEYFLSLTEPLNQSNFKSCASISSDVIKFSEIVGFDDGVFIGEVFESVFLQVDNELSRFLVTEDEILSLKTKLLVSIVSISKCYEVPDKTELYNSLKEMRLIATKFQYQLRRQCKIRQQASPFQLPIQLR